MGGYDLLQMRVWIRKIIIISFKTCYRSVCNHPIAVGMILFAMALNRSSPFLFSLLVSSSPVLVCTAILLGILLSFGKPNIPETEKEYHMSSHEATSLKTRASKGATSAIERDGHCALERLTVKRRDILEKAIADLSSAGKKISLTERDDSSLCNSPLIDRKSQELRFEMRTVERANCEFVNSGLEENKTSFDVGMEDKGLEGDDEDVEIQYLRVQEVGVENLEEEHDKSLKLRKSIGNVSAEQLASSPGSSKHDEYRGDDSSDSRSESGSDSDGAESSSPDASMTDILPMLDELHPLLDSDAPQPIQDDFDGASEQSHKNEDGSDELEEDIEHQEEEEDGDDDNDDEEAQIGDKSDVIKSAITWTEDDQKNLIDLGTSELERNRQLENLLARRKARKIMATMKEKNLIDLESTDLPFPVAPISTGKRNPFDLPYDSYDDTSIPGSAPSILLPRRNPFDIPYDPNVEKSDLTSGGFHQELMPPHQKDMAFRRHESFSLGPSHLGIPRQDRSDLKFRSYFLPGKLAPEGTSYSSFQRLSREGNSKLSALPETESLGSPVHLEDKTIVEHDLVQETDMASDHVARGSQSSGEMDSVCGDIKVEKRNVDLNEPKIKLDALENHGEVESSSEKGLPSMLSSLSETENLSLSVGLNDREIHIKTEAVELEEEYSSRSTTSSLSEESEEIIDVKQTEGLAAPDPESGGPFKCGMSRQPSLQDSDCKLTGGSTDATDIKDPVYDSSPLANSKNVSSRSSSSVSSDLHVEASEMGSPLVSLKAVLPSPDNEFEVLGDVVDKDAPGNGEALSSRSFSSISSDLHVEVSEMGSPMASLKTALPSPDNESEVRGDVVDKEAPGNGEVLAESIVENASNDLSPSSDINVAVKDMVYIDKVEQNRGDQISLSSLVGESSVEGSSEKGDFTTPRDKFMSSEGSTASAPVEPHPPLAVEHQYIAHPNSSSKGTDTVEKHLMDQAGIHQSGLSDIHPLSSVEKTHINVSQDWDENLVSTDSNNQGMRSEEKAVLEEQLPEVEKSIVEPPSDNHEGHKVGVEHIAKEANEIKDTDGEILSGAKTNGDFSVKRRESNVVEIEKHPDAVPESLSKLQDPDRKLTGGVEDNHNGVHKTAAVIPSENISAFELPASEASSAEHVDSPLHFIHEVKTSMVPQPMHEEIVLEKSEVELANSPRATRKTGLPAIKTDTAEDIDLATTETEVKPSETILEKSKVEFADSPIATQNSGFSVTKTCMGEDIAMDAKETEVKACRNNNQLPEVLDC